MFSRSGFGANGAAKNLSIWDVTNVTSMSEMFSGILSDSPQRRLNVLQNWDTSNVENMARMFYYCISNPSIANWNNSNITNMNDMFRNNTTIKRNLQNWDVQNVTIFGKIFLFASAMLDNYNLPQDGTASVAQWHTYW